MTAIIMLLNVASGAAQPASPEVLTLPAAISQALKQNKAMDAAAAYQDAAGARLGQARAGLRPKINYAESWTRSDNPVFCLLYTSPSPRDLSTSRMPSSA